MEAQGMKRKVFPAALHAASQRASASGSAMPPFCLTCVFRPFNPLTRVPALVRDDGEVLVESRNILDYRDSFAPEGQAMFPQHEPQRHTALRIAALATGLGEKSCQRVL